MSRMLLNTLIVLETGVVADEKEVFSWPGNPDTVRYGSRPDIYRNLNLREAFKLSAVWVYLAAAGKIGKDRYKDYLTRCRYGNADVSVDGNDFWNFGNLAVSPVNQIEMLIGIYEETLPFSKRSFRILKELMIEERTETYTLRAKTGWSRDGGIDNGWWVGYVERAGNVYFFATRIIKDRQTKNPKFRKCRKEITRTILRQLKVLD